MYQVIEEKYHEEVEIPALKEKKQQLKALRSLARPIEHDKIKKHAKSYSQIRKKDLQMKKAQIWEKMEKNQWEYDKSQYETRTARNVIWHDLRLRKENEHRQKIKEELRSK